MPHIKLTSEVETVIRNSRIEGSKLFLPNQLDRKLYTDVNKVLANSGGEWNKSLKAHLFEGDPLEKLGLALETGISRDEKKDLQAYFTPPDLAARVVELAEVSGCTVLEPSAGEGALVKECVAQGAKDVTCVEINPKYVDVLRSKGYRVFGGDFLLDFPLIPSLGDSRRYDRVVMNPPFTKNQDVKFVERAFSFLKIGGKLVSIMAGNKERESFKKLIKDKNYEIVDVPAGSFKESGTMVNTFILIINK